MALIAAPLLKMTKSALKANGGKTSGSHPWPLIISLISALLIWLGHVNPVWVILATIVLTLLAVDIAERRHK